MKVSEDTQDGIRTELYRSLREEWRSYVSKGVWLWLQKFLLIGATFAVWFADWENAPKVLAVVEPGWTTRAFIVWLPGILAVLIDIKMLEHALHARLISNFIIRKFDGTYAADWEINVWAGAAGQSRALALTRCVITTVASLGPTIVLVLLAAVLLDHSTVWVGAATTFLSYVIAAIFFWRHVFLTNPREEND